MFSILAINNPSLLVKECLYTFEPRDIKEIPKRELGI